MPHDPRWAQLFETAAAELFQLLGSRVTAVEHIGSTAVSGLDAKPVLDIMASVSSLHLPESFFEDIQTIGYQHRPMDTVTGRLFFAKGPENCRTHNLSVCEKGSTFWKSHILFRDRLRSDLSLAARYAALKHELAKRFPDDRLAYTQAKERFILKAIGS